MSAATPQPIDNPAGLPQVRYRTGAYGEFRASLHAALGAASRRALAGLSTREDEDFTIALLDGVACAADVLTFYSERWVNEFFLRTAQDRMSIVELGRLVGHRLRPGVAATTYLAFHVEPPPPAPVAAAISPFRAVHMAPCVRIGAGTPVRSIPGPGEQPQTFETAEAIDARPEWNLIRPAPTRRTVLGPDTTAMYVWGSASGLKPGDLLLFLSRSPADVRIRPIESAVPQPEHDRTLVTWRGRLDTPGSRAPLVFRRRLSVFGHNAPMWRSLSDDFRANYGSPNSNKWPDYTITVRTGLTYRSPNAWSPRVDVDGSHPDIRPGSFIVLAAGNLCEHFAITDVDEFTRAEFGVAGKVTRLSLDTDLERWRPFRDQVRQTTVHAVSEKLILVDEPDTAPVQQAGVTVDGDCTAMAPGRTLLVAAGGAVERVTLRSATPGPSGRTSLEFTGALVGQYERDTVTIFGNVARATHGETAHQILGDGQAAHAFQAFELKHAPLTYTPSDDPSGSSSTLEVRVGDVAWREVSSLYGTGPGDRMFVTRELPSGQVVVATGDGVHGSRLPTGQHNVRAVLRKGIGTPGNVPAGALTQLAAPPLGVTGVTNPAPAEGGADPDTPDAARANIPLSTRTLGRAVSLADYADYARSFAGIAKAHAAVMPVRNVRTIVVTVAGPDGAVVPDVTRARLATSMRGHGDPLAPVLILAHRPVPVTLSIAVRRHPDHALTGVLAAVADRLRTRFAFAARDFGQPVHRSEVISAAHGAPGVIAVDLETLARAGALPTGGSLTGKGPEILAGVPVGAELLLLSADPLPWLSELP